MAIEEKVKSFANETSMHGAAKVILSKSPVKRALWLLIFVGAWTMFISQTTLVMINYFSYPKKVSVAVVKAKDDRVPFPDVTVCNMRPLNFYSVKQLEEYYIKYGYETMTKTGNKFVDAYTMTMEMSWRLSSQVNENASWIDVKRSDIKLNILPEILRDNIISKDEFIVQCSFQYEECDRLGSFMEVDHHHFFRCFTYSTNVTSMLTGPEDGLSLTLMTGNGMLTNDDSHVHDPNRTRIYIPGLYQEKSSTSGSEGVRVVVHPPNTVANPIAEGLDIPPGYTVSLGLKPKRYIRVKKPFGDCVDENPFVSENRFFADNVTAPYRQIDCEHMCYQKQIVDACDCYDSSLNLLPNMSCRTDEKRGDGVIASIIERRCYLLNNEGDSVSSYLQCGDLQVYCNESASLEECVNETRNDSILRREEMECIKKSGDEETREGKCSDQCPFPCSEYEYDVTYSLSKWPAKGSETDAVYFDIFDNTKYMDRFTSDPDKYLFYKKYKERAGVGILDDFLRLNVYWLTNKVITTEESALYSPQSLISDIGGQFGLWIGVSVITLSELMELIVSACVSFFRRAKKKGVDGETGKQTNIVDDETKENKEAVYEDKDAVIHAVKELIGCLKKRENADICHVVTASLNEDEESADHAP